MSALKKVFTEARALLDDRDHWCRRRYMARPGCYCILGACLVASGVKEDVLGGPSLTTVRLQPRLSRFTSVLEACIRKLDDEGAFEAGAFTVAAFNDSLNTRHVDVLMVLDCAIECS